MFQRIFTNRRRRKHKYKTNTPIPFLTSCHSTVRCPNFVQYFLCDYCQNEVQILSHMSSDSTLIKMFQDDNVTDIYKQMSSTIKGKVFGEKS